MYVHHTQGTRALCKCKQRKSIIVHNYWPDHMARLWTDISHCAPALFSPSLFVLALLRWSNSLYFLFPSLFQLAGSCWPPWKRWYPRPAWTAWTSRPSWTPRPRWSKLFLHNVSEWIFLLHVFVFVKCERKDRGEERSWNASNLGPMGQSPVAILHHGGRAEIFSGLF